MNRNLFLYIATSIDGYIAAPGDDLSFLDIPTQEGEDYGYNQFIAGIDMVILGRRTYDWVMKQVTEFPHADKKTFVITRQSIPPIGNIQFYNGDLKELVGKLKSEDGKNIFCDGGAQVIRELLHHDLIDECIISVIPVLLGDGIRLFQGPFPQLEMEHLSTQTYSNGLVQSHYRRKRN